MKPVYVDGIGIISRCGCTAEEIADITSGSKPCDTYPSGKISFDSVVKPSKLRRCSGYIKLACEMAARAAADGEISSDSDMYRIGTVISTGYGAVESNADFADSVVRGDPALCSPTVFSATVPNSCIGQICIIGGYKGAGTLLMGGDPIEYSALLIHTGKADKILCGSVEEYSKELAGSFSEIAMMSETEISEGAAGFILSATRSDKTYCKITAFGSASFEAYPYIHKVTETEAEEIILSALSQIGKNAPLESFSPELILTSANGTYFDCYEEKVLNEYFGVKSKCVAAKKYFGETLGSGYMLNAATAAASIKFGRSKSALVTGLDSAGNYCCLLAEAV